MEILTDYDNEVYKTQVMNSPEGSLFKQWASPLNRLQREKGEISVMDIWQTSTQCIEKLYQAGGNKIDEIPFIYTSLIKECSIIKQGRNTINRTRAEAEASAQLIMTVTATRSLNYIQPGHEEDPVSENDGVVLKIMNEIGKPAFDKYAELFFSQKTNIYGEKIVIDSYNPFTAKDANTTPTLQKEARRKAVLTKVLANTQKLENILQKTDYDDLQQCFENICNDDTLLTQFEMKKPNANTWGINRKMALNIIAIYVNKRNINIPMHQINTTIGGSNNSPYLTHHRPYNDNRTACGITTDNYNAIVRIIEAL
ncbi:MAG: hypothetical protein HXO13_08705 [Prevotella salivae]|nr:hypothetical protein [Segatella salivae]